jgi:hypothetical protein
MPSAFHHRAAGPRPFEGFASRQPPEARGADVPAGGPALEGRGESLQEGFCRQAGAASGRITAWPALQGGCWFEVERAAACAWLERQCPGKACCRSCARDRDLIFYDAGAGEIWISAGNREDRDLYRRQLGLSLGGATDYFPEMLACTLEPLRAEGADALDPRGAEGIREITLRQLDVDWGNGFHLVTAVKADDLFACGAACRRPGDVIPKTGRLARAVFGAQFAGAKACRKVELYPPTVLKLEEPGDLESLAPWLTLHGFIASEN